jgi:hypothetical protein
VDSLVRTNRVNNKEEGRANAGAPAKCGTVKPSHPSLRILGCGKHTQEYPVTFDRV